MMKVNLEAADKMLEESGYKSPCNDCCQPWQACLSCKSFEFFKPDEGNFVFWEPLRHQKGAIMQGDEQWLGTIVL